MLRAANPVVATYARADWLDVRISAVDERDAGGRIVRSAREVLETAEVAVRDTLGGHVWPRVRRRGPTSSRRPRRVPASGSPSSRRHARGARRAAV